MTISISLHVFPFFSSFSFFLFVCKYIYSYGSIIIPLATVLIHGFVVCISPPLLLLLLLFLFISLFIQVLDSPAGFICLLLFCAVLGTQIMFGVC